MSNSEAMRTLIAVVLLFIPALTNAGDAVWLGPDRKQWPDTEFRKTIDLCVTNRHHRGVRVLFGYETTGKPRGAGAPAATRGRPLEGGRLNHGGRPAARMFPQLGHPVA